MTGQWFELAALAVFWAVAVEVIAVCAGIVVVVLVAIVEVLSGYKRS